MDKHQSALKSQEGVAYFKFKCAKLNYYFREVVHHDKGVDCEIEITQSLAVESSIIAVQIKSRTNVYITQENEITLTVTDQNIEYWKSYGRPVILVVYIDENKPMHWVRVDNHHSKTIRVPVSNVFDETTLSHFSQIIMEFYNNLARKMKVKDVSLVLSEFGFDGTVDNVLDPIADSLYEAKELIEQEQYYEASKIYESLASIYKKHCLINYNWGTILLKIDQFDKVFEIANDLYREFPNRYEPLELFGSASASIGNYDSAAHHLAKAILLKPNDPALWNKIGLVHYWNSEFTLAVLDFKTSLEHEANDFVYFNLAICLTAMQNYKEALFYYDAAIDLNDKFYDAYNNKGLLLKDLWRISEAILAFEKAISLQVRNSYALCNIAFLLKDLGKDNDALRYYNNALRISPSTEHIHMNLGLLYSRLNQYTKAESHFNRVYSTIYDNQSENENVGIVDIGYEVAYLITLEVCNGTTRVVDVQNVPDISLFKGIPLMRDVVEHAESKKLTQSIMYPEPSETIKKGLEIRNQRIKKNKVRKTNKRGIWVWGTMSVEDEKDKDSAFGIFSIEDKSYYDRVVREIQRRVSLDYNSYDEIDLVTVDETELNVIRTEAIDVNNQIEIKFENRLFQEIYFNINFNGYFLAGISSGKIDTTFPFLNYKNLRMRISFTCMSSEGHSKMFSIDNIVNIISKN